jgi:DNA (cytosine-5)-methyltransferase 1
MKLTHASLETGFGGFDLAAEQEGYENVFQCEIDPFCQTILKYHFPNADQYGDIRKFNATKYHGKINVLTAGFPCQPFSVAGTQKGVDDERFIWPENFRIIRQCKPDWLILENVAGIFGVSEPTSIAQVENEATFLFHQEKEQETIHERVIKRIIDDLHQAGYILPTDTKGTPIIFVIPACAVNAPHRRDRMFIVANANNDRKGKARNSTNTNQIGCNGWSSTFRRERDDKSRCRIFGKPKRLCKCPITPNTNRRFSKQPKRKIQTRWQAFINGREWITPNTTSWKNFPTEPPLCGGDDGLPSELDNITFPKWRAESIKGYGNAVVVPLVRVLLKTIKQVYQHEKPFSK